MSNFIKLVLINIKSTFYNNVIGSKNKSLKVLSYIIIFGLPFAYMFFLAYTLGEQLLQDDIQHFLVVLALVGSIILALFNSIFSSFDMLFKSKDYEFITSLPVKESTVFLSKFVSVLLLNYLYSIMLFLPFFTMYFILSGVTFISLFSSVIIFLFLPFIPISLGLLIGLLINLITTKLRFKKLFTFILLFAILFGSFYVSNNINQAISYFATNSESITQSISKVYYPIYLALDSVLNSNILSLLLFALISIVPTFILTFIFSKYFVRLNSFFMKSHNKINKKIKQVSNNSVSKALIKKEIKRLFASPLYVFNSCLGPVLLLVFSIILNFVPSESIIGFNISDNVYIIFLVVAILNLFMSPLACTISLEGENFWIIKSSPIEPKKYLLTKILLQLVIFIPLNIVAILVFAISFKLSILIIALLILTCFICVLFSSLLALFINLKNYNLHYKNELFVIKQSSAVLIDMLVGMFSAFLLMIIKNLIFVNLSTELCVLIYNSILIIASIIILKNLFTISQEKFNNID